MVELNENFDEGATKTASSVETAAPEEAAPEETSTESGTSPGLPAQPAPSIVHQAHQPSLPQLGSQADAVRLVGEILRNATTARWPMYLRNVKQILRQYRDGNNGAGPGEAGGFDERRYGFGGLIDLLRACQRDGLVRLERDRRGGLRVFQGAALQRAGAPNTREQEAAPPSAHLVETAPGGAVDIREADEADAVDFEPMPTVDPTAVLLGTAKRKRGPRAPRPAAPHVAAPKKAAPRGARKSAAKRPARAKKAGDADAQPD
jgi:hypothetical protein